MRTVRQLLASKTPDIFAIAPGDAVLDAIKAMAQQRVGALLVMEGEQLVGIVSERDYARKIVLEGRSSRDTPVRDIMSAQLVTIAPDDSVGQCMQLMTDHRIRHLPVLDAGTVCGVVSIGDLVKAVIEDQRLELDHLQRYIAS